MSLSFLVLRILPSAHCEDRGDGGESTVHGSSCPLGAHSEQGALQTSPLMLLKILRVWDHHNEETEAQRGDAAALKSHS